MYTTLSDQAQPTSDLAARLTDLGLKILAGAAMPTDSVETELQLWHTLEAELERERRWQRFLPRRGEVAPVGRVLQQVVSRATRRVAGDRELFSNNPGERAERADEYLCQV
jgi:hypothetical protein